MWTTSADNRSSCPCNHLSGESGFCVRSLRASSYAIVAVVAVVVTAAAAAAASGSSSNLQGRSGGTQSAADIHWQVVGAGGNAPHDGLYLATSEKPTPRFLVRARGAFGPRWSPDGSTIAFVSGEKTMNSASSR
jgi:WD40-like Beta Propeller Repeat